VVDDDVDIESVRMSEGARSRFSAVSVSPLYFKRHPYPEEWYP
jgi:hypothetical protein